MAPYLFFFSVSIIALAYGTYTDFRERIVSNWVTYGMVALGLAGHAIWSFLASDITIVGYSAFATAATFGFSYLLYRAGVWAGGDVKLFTGLAALNPLNPNILTRLGIISLPFFQVIELPVFPLTLFVFSLFAMLPYGAVLAAARLARNKPEKEKFWKESRQRLLQGISLAAAAVGLSAAMTFLNLSQLLVLPLIFAFAFVPKKARLALAGLLLLFGLWLNAEQAGPQFGMLLAFFLGFYLLLKLYSLSKVLMRKPVKVSELKEGMISAQTLVQKGKRVEIVPEMGIKKLIKYLAQNRFGKAMQLAPKGKEIVSSRSAAGLTEKQIAQLKKLAKEKRIPGRLMVKESAPFVPAVLAAYIALNIVGDVIWLWFL